MTPLNTPPLTTNVGWVNANMGRSCHTFATLSVAIGILPYMVVACLIGVLIAVRQFGFLYGMDVLVYGVAIMAICPILGLWLGVVALRSSADRRRIAIIGLTLNCVNGLLLFIASLFVC